MRAPFSRRRDEASGSTAPHIQPVADLVFVEHSLLTDAEPTPRASKRYL